MTIIKTHLTLGRQMINVWTTFTLAVMNLAIDNGGFVLTVVKVQITKGYLTDMRQKLRGYIHSHSGNTDYRSDGSMVVTARRTGYGETQ